MFKLAQRTGSNGQLSVLREELFDFCFVCFVKKQDVGVPFSSLILIQCNTTKQGFNILVMQRHPPTYSLGLMCALLFFKQLVPLRGLEIGVERWVTRSALEISRHPPQGSQVVSGLRANAGLFDCFLRRVK